MSDFFTIIDETNGTQQMVSRGEAEDIFDGPEGLSDAIDGAADGLHVVPAGFDGDLTPAEVALEMLY